VMGTARQTLCTAGIYDGPEGRSSQWMEATCLKALEVPVLLEGHSDSKLQPLPNPDACWVENNQPVAESPAGLGLITLTGLGRLLWPQTPGSQACCSAEEAWAGWDPGQRCREFGATENLDTDVNPNLHLGGPRSPQGGQAPCPLPLSYPPSYHCG
jgi:hypothetical protein